MEAKEERERENDCSIVERTGRPCSGTLDSFFTRVAKKPFLIHSSTCLFLFLLLLPLPLLLLLCLVENLKGAAALENDGCRQARNLLLLLGVDVGEHRVLALKQDGNNTVVSNQWLCFVVAHGLKEE